MTSRLYPHEQTIPAMIEPPAYNAPPIPLDATQTARLATLKVETFHRLPESLLRFAIKQGKDQELVKTTREMFKLNFDLEDGDLDDILQGDRLFPSTGN